MWKLLALTGLAAVVVLGLMAASTGAASPVTVASGSFTLHGSDGSNRTIAFSVQQSSDGTVTGQATARSFSGDNNHSDVTCLIREGNQAIVGGIITTSTNPSNVGIQFAFAIQDNPDISTLAFFGYDSPPANPCEDLISLSGEDLPSLLADFGFPITTGNIRISP
ncbi:MAG TPA: hypothetical protein VGP69_04645 [Gaiellaceae bacterium]|jgi:hypothetical protein|nr:hypothetical protein [Gaiellaceae bacterium]